MSGDCFSGFKPYYEIQYTYKYPASKQGIRGWALLRPSPKPKEKYAG